MAIEFRRDGPWELPRGWVWAQLGEIGEIVGGTTVDKNRRPIDPITLPYLRVANVQRGHLLLDKIKTVTVERKVGEALALQPGDILLNEGGDRDKIGRGWVWEGQIPQCIHQNHVFRVRLRDTSLNPYFISYFANEFGRTFFMAEGKQTTNLASISMSKIRQLPVPIAPIAEQRRIVKRIDELFSEIADGETALTRARADLDTWRRALLKAAVTGELTREWRKNHTASSTGTDLVARLRREHPDVPSIIRRWSQDKASLPGTWAWAAVEEAGEVQLGRQRAPQHHSGRHMRPYLRVANVYEDRLALEDVKWMNFAPNEFEIFSLRSGDILLNEGQSPDLLGRPAIYRGEIEGCCFQNTLLRFRSYEGIDPEFALLVFRHYMHAGRFKREARITTNIAHLSRTRFAAIEFPVPPIEEQIVIVQIVRSLEADANGHIRAANEAPLDSLRQAVLRSAFAGRLVEQDAAEESAAALLARVSAVARNAAPTRRRSRERAAQ
jgi:type I restriction enzyme S subunit